MVSSNRTPTTASSGSFDVGWLLRAVSHRRRLFALMVVIGLLLGIAASFIASGSYTGTASVKVSPVNISIPVTIRLTDQINMETEAAQASSREVADRAVAALEKQKLTGFTSNDLRDATEVVVPTGSLVMRISVTESSSARAVAAANAMARAYLSDRQQAALTARNATLTGLDAQIKATGTATDAALNRLQTLNARRAEVSSVSTSPGTLISESRGPLTVSSPGVLKLAIGGIVLGVILGFFAVIIRERLERRLPHPEAVAELVDAPVRRLSSEDELFDGFATALLSRDGTIDTANTVALVSTSPRAGHYVGTMFERVAAAQNINLTRREISLSTTGRVMGYRPIKSAVVLVDAAGTTDAVQARTASDTATAVLVVTPVTTRKRLMSLLDALQRERATVDVVIFADDHAADAHPSALATTDAVSAEIADDATPPSDPTDGETPRPQTT